MSCRPGMLFSAVSKLCEVAANVRCENMFDVLSNYPRTTTPVPLASYDDPRFSAHLEEEVHRQSSSRMINLREPPHPAQDEQADLEVKQFGGISCEGDHGLEPHPEDCSMFLNCVNGNGVVQQCGPGTVFNQVIQVCDWPYNVDCSRRNRPHHYGEYNIDVRMGSGRSDDGNVEGDAAISEARLNAIRNYALNVKPISRETVPNYEAGQRTVSGGYSSGSGRTSDRRGFYGAATNYDEDQGQRTLSTGGYSGTSINRYGSTSATENQVEDSRRVFGAAPSYDEDEGQHTVPLQPQPSNQYGSDGSRFYGAASDYNEGQQTVSLQPDGRLHGAASGYDEDEGQQTVPFHPQTRNQYGRQSNINEEGADEGQQTVQLDQFAPNNNRQPSSGHYIHRTSANSGLQDQLTTSQRYNQHMRRTTTPASFTQDDADEGQQTVQLDQFASNSNQQAGRSSFQDQIYTSQRYNQHKRRTTTPTPITTTAVPISAFDQEYQRNLEDRIHKHTSTSTTTTAPISVFDQEYQRTLEERIRKYGSSSRSEIPVSNTPSSLPSRAQSSVVIEQDASGNQWAYQTISQQQRQPSSADQRQTEAQRTYTNLRDANTFASHSHQTREEIESDLDTQQTVNFDADVQRSYADVRNANTFSSQPHPRPNYENSRQQESSDQLLKNNEEGNVRRTVSSTWNQQPVNTFVAPSEWNAESPNIYANPPIPTSDNVDAADLEESLRILDSYTNAAAPQVPSRQHITPIYSRSRNDRYFNNQQQQLQQTTGEATTVADKLVVPNEMSADHINEALHAMLHHYPKGHIVTSTPNYNNNKLTTTEQTPIAETTSQLRSENQSSGNRNELEVTVDKFGRPKGRYTTPRSQQLPNTTQKDVELLLPAASVCEFDCMKNGVCVEQAKVRTKSIDN